MPLESLRQPFDPEQAGHKLREVQVEHEAQPEGAAREKFEALRNSGFYDPEKHRWFTREDLQKSLTMDQFLGMLALAEFDVNSAKLEWQNLKGGQLYDQDNNDLRWVWAEMSTNIPTAKFTSLAVQMIFEKQKALQEYALLCEQLNRNDAWFMPQPLDGSQNINAQTEFLHLLLQSEINLSATRNRYEALKRTKLYVPEVGLWRTGYFANTRDTSDSSHSSDLLLSFLVELQLGIPGIAERYEAAKNSPLFDRATQQWNSAMDHRGQDSEKLVRSQLLAVIIESRLEKLGQQKLATPTKLPEERNF